MAEINVNETSDMMDFEMDLDAGRGFVTDRWIISSDMEADWAIRKIKAAKEEAAKWIEYYTQMIEKASTSTQRTVDFFTSRLQEYFETVPHRETKTQEKYALPSGDLVMRKARTVYQHDDAALLKWAKENGYDDCVKVTEKVSWTDMKKRLAEVDGEMVDPETGVICDAVSVVTEDAKFSISLNDKEE